MFPRTFVAGSLALALGAAACADGSNDGMDGRAQDPANEAAADRRDSAGTTASTATGHEGANITLTGCLQKQDGLMDSFILTQVNEPSGAVGTSGSGAEREQMRAAKHSYQLEVEDNDDFDKLVGKQVRVTGKLQEMSDLSRGTAGSTANDNRAGANNRADGNNRADADRRDIDANDLAKVDVETVTQVADACGNAR
jgi:hypothetical protein